MANKITKKEYFNMVANVIEMANPANKEELLDFINHEVELLDRKSNNTKPTKTQKENMKIMDIIREVLAEVENPVTVTELNKDARLSDYTIQKISALLKKLVDAGEVVKVIEKKKAYFSCNSFSEEEEEEEDVE